MTLLKKEVADMKKFLCLFAAATALLLTGCVSVENISEAQLVMDKEIKMGETMLDAFAKRDFEAFMQYTPAGSREQYNKDKFIEEQRELIFRMGEVDSYRFLTKLEFEPMHQYVWAVRFLSYSLKGEKIYKECLFVIVVGEVDEQRKVFLFGFK